MMHHRCARVALISLLVVTGTPTWARAQVLVKASDTVIFRLGFQLQTWADWTQDQVSEGYSASFFLRRVRFILAGQLGRDVSFFFQTDNPRLGNAGTGTGTPPKNLASG